MNYELISKMTYAELRALEYDLNRVKCERSDFGYTEKLTTEEKARRQERDAKDRARQLEINAEWDKQNQEEWETKLRRREYLKTYQQRVDEFDITSMNQLPEAVGVLILGFVGLEKRTSCRQNNTLVKIKNGDTSYKARCVLNLCRLEAFKIHEEVCVANFEKMKMTKIKTFFAPNAPLQHFKKYFKLNSKEKFIECLKNWWSEINAGKIRNRFMLMIYIASTR